MTVTSRPPDLLDLLAHVDDEGPMIVHAIMPWMGYACGTACACGGCGSSYCPCGGGCLGQSDRHQGTTSYSEVTCPDCLAMGDLRSLSRDAQRPERMAPVIA